MRARVLYLAAVVGVVAALLTIPGPAGAATVPAPVACDTRQGACWHPALNARWQYQLQGVAQLRDRIREPALLAQRIAEIESRRREVRIERDGARPVPDRIRSAAERPQREADVVMEVRDVAVERDGTTDQLHRIFVASGRMRERATQLQRMRILRIGREHLTVEAVCLGQLSGLVVPERSGQCGVS